jgi:exopolysaccharide biosynthesis polyprenyl glycosylphosphotransferase
MFCGAGRLGNSDCRLSIDTGGVSSAAARRETFTGVSDAPTLQPAPGGPQSRSAFPRRRARPDRGGLVADLHSAREEDRHAQAPDGGLGTARPNRRDAFFRRLLAAADLLAGAGGLVALSLLSRREFEPVSLLAVPLIIVYAKATGRYDHDDLVLRKSTLDEIPALLTLAAAFALTWSLVGLLAGVRAASGEAVIVWAATSGLLVVLRAGARAAAQRSAPRERLLIVGGSHARDSLARCIAADPGAHVDVVGFLPLEDERQANRGSAAASRRRRSLSFEDLPATVSEQEIDRVLLIPTTADGDLMLDAVRRTIGLGVKVSIVPRLFEVIGSAVEFDSVGGTTVLGVRPGGLSRSSHAVKRAMDIAGALVGLLVLAPLGLLVAVRIKLDSPGPVFFRQARVGRDSRAFSMIKFRSMVHDAEAQRAALLQRNETRGLFKLTDDPRVTRVGRWLRRTSIDELPQLVNVLRGEMSLVGPRPLVLHEDRLVEGRHRERLALTPGMTGPWQVLGPHRPPLDEMVKIDYLYAANWSLWGDLKIVLRTFAHMLRRRGR